MQLLLCIGLLESRDGPFLGLRDLVQGQIVPRYPATTPHFYSYKDDLTPILTRAAAAAKAASMPLILLGHSYGASALFRAVQKNAQIRVDHLILLDPVPRWLWGQFQWSCYQLPPNVQAATCIYNPWSLPKSSPIRGRNPRYRNIHVSPLHASIPGDREVQSHILEIIHAMQPKSPPEAMKIPPVVRMGL